MKLFGHIRKQRFISSDQYIINVLLFRPIEIKAHIFLILGRNECIYKYNNIALNFYKQNIAVTIYDHRGQGFNKRLLESDQCHIESYNIYINDLKDIINNFKMPLPTFILAVSMGGLITLNFLLKYQKNININNNNSFNINGVIFIAPFLGIKHLLPEIFIKFLVDIKSYFYGQNSFCFKNDHYKPKTYGVNANTSDLNKFNRYNNLYVRYPHASLGGVSNQWLLSSLKALHNIRRKWELPVKTLFLLAEKDNMVSISKSKLFLSKHSNDLNKPIINIIPNSLHDILLEDDQISFLALKYIYEFLNKNSK